MTLLRYIVTALSILVASASAHAQVNADRVTDVGRNAMYFEDYLLAIQYFNLAIEAKPYLARPWLYRAVAKLNLDDCRGAEADATQAIARNPYLADAYEVRAVARQSLRRPQEAIADYDSALLLLPDNRRILYNKALAQTDCGDTHAAIATFDHIIAVTPNDDAAHTARARSLISLGDTIAALADLDRAISLNKNSANAYAMRADIYLRTDTAFARATDDLDHAIKLRPTVAGLYVNRAYSRYRSDDFRGAMADYDYALTIDPINMAALLNRSILRIQVGDYDRAITDLDRIITIEPDNTSALFNRATLLYQRGDLRGSLHDFDRVTEILPDEPAPYFARVEIYEQLGQRTKAIENYDKAIALYPTTLEQVQQHISRHVNNERERAARVKLDESDTFAGASARFSNLVTVQTDIPSTEQRYNNPDIRGRLQERDVPILPQPMFVATYYPASRQLNTRAIHSAYISDINQSKRLPMSLVMTTDEDVPTDAATRQMHTNAIATFTDAISAPSPAAIDYFARAIEHFTLGEYGAAESDFTNATDVVATFVPAYVMRAATRYRIAATSADDSAARLNTLLGALADCDNALAIDPVDIFAAYNRGCILLSLHRWDEAIDTFSYTLRLDDTLGQAYYNRAYALLQTGHSHQAVDDLSRAGQLGVASAYNLLKRLSN